MSKFGDCLNKLFHIKTLGFYVAIKNVTMGVKYNRMRLMFK